MKRRLWLQMLALSVVITLVLSTLGLIAFRSITAPASSEGRKNIYLFLANLLDSAPYAQSLQMLERFRVESPSLVSHVWIVSNDGYIYAKNTSLPLPGDWNTAPLPQGRHEMAGKIKPLHLFPEFTVIRLGAERPTFAVIKPRDLTPNKMLVRAEITLFILGLFGAASSGLAMTFLYLRKTSREAKWVISQLRAGDLHARFNIRKFDEIGNLKLDFNAMADEIERLVHRVQTTEAARKNLLQELGHDLRTPLTSLRTSIETLAAYREQMSAQQQREFLGVIQSELNYFVRLLDDLFFIADIAEPGYRGNVETIDMKTLLETEVHARRVAQPQLTWELNCLSPAIALRGDSHLLLRLLRNTLDNAAKFASRRIVIAAQEMQNGIEIVVADDGPGMTADAVHEFGERKKHRVRAGSTPLNVSLGLGSVIIKTIVDLHGGELRIQSSAIEPQLERGTRFIFSFGKM